MQQIEQVFDILPVGQGLFYTGLIKAQFNNGANERFRFVFDCGSITAGAGNDEVDFFRANDFSGEDRLGLLVISHFDEDHVNKIGRLIAGKKINKVIMPFSTLAERVFLALRQSSISAGGDDDDFFKRFMVDPLAVLGDALDGDSQVFFITGPDDFPGGSAEESPQEQSSRSDDTRLTFDFGGMERSVDIEQQRRLGNMDTPSGVTLSTVHFRHPGLLKTNTSQQILMDFLFYRRDIGKDEEFFARVLKRFCEVFNVSVDGEGLPETASLTAALQGIRGATRIKQIFNEVKGEFLQLSGQGHQITNMNTTALALLHRNRPEILRLFNTNDFYHLLHHAEIIQKRKLNGSRVSYVECDDYYYHRGYHRLFRSFEHRLPDFRFVFPNVLLTSDGFYKNEQEAANFIRRYAAYWEEFWLFQIPHHGSANNIGKPLLVRLMPRQCNFINFGTRHKHSTKWQHPWPAVINDMVAAGQHTCIHPITEFSGLRFSIEMRG